MLNGLSLFSGIGGLDVALSEWVKPIAYCEIDPYCQGVLLSRMADESLCNCPIWDDVKTLEGNIFKGAIDIIYGGFPCQDISVAGHGKGLAGERSGLFYEIIRLCSEINPRFIFLENVPAITVRGGTEVVREIASLGYDCRWCVISAASIGALHKRERWFLLAHAYDNGLSSCENRGSIRKSITQREQHESTKSFGETERTSSLSSDVADSRCDIQRSKKESEWSYDKSTRRCRFWETEPSVGRVVNGLPFRVERLRGLGNAVVPQQAKEAFKILMGL